MAGEPYRVKVGAVRPSHLMFTSGVGALVDLPSFSTIVLGLEEWKYFNVVDRNVIVEPRLLEAVKQWQPHRHVAELRSAPWVDETEVGDELAARTGVPTRPFPSYLRCTACNELGTIESRIFRFENLVPSRPQDAKFVHVPCPRVRRGKPPLAVAARFVLACTSGHLDDFPYVPFVHHGLPCSEVKSPAMTMEDRGGNLGANVELRCQACGEHRNIRDALGERGEQNLPACRGRHPHLGIFQGGGCKAQVKVLVVGASNQWFARTMSVLSVPRTDAGALATLVEKYWDSALSKLPTRDMLTMYWGMPNPISHEFEGADLDQIWAEMEAHRTRLAGTGEDGRQATATDLRTPEWEIFTAAKPPEPSDDFTLHRDPDGVPKELTGVYSDVVQAERLREVRALVGFTRLDSPDPDDPDLVVTAPLTRGEATWIPTSEVRGEGLFFRIPEELLLDWERRVDDSPAMTAHVDAYQEFRRRRYSGRIKGDFDPMKNWPGMRYLALHTFSHLLIRTIAIECGYSSASLSERIYSSTDDDHRGGILIYTAVPDAEGTLGGLVSLGEPRELLRITRRALRDARHCSSDPLCGERLPHAPAEDFLHGAACHVCLFVSETTCERGNRFLDRRFVVPIGDDKDLALFPDLP